jgi:hypothetical protein
MFLLPCPSLPTLNSFSYTASLLGASVVVSLLLQAKCAPSQDLELPLFSVMLYPKYPLAHFLNSVGFNMKCHFFFFFLSVLRFELGHHAC